MSSKYLSALALSTSAILLTLMWMMVSKEMVISMEWTMMKLLSSSFEVKMEINNKSVAFASCVLLITSAIITYSEYYMSSSKKKNQFMKLIMAFITSMMILIFSSNMISMIAGWEGLGMSSFILIMFYQNKKSLNSGFYTMIMNRLGDIMMMMSMINMMNLSSWTFSSPMFSQSYPVISMMMVGAFSKSAQMPFSSWLTEAMAAPTPISALVHSSTLVTAGVFLFVRFESILKYQKTAIAIFLVSTTTLIMASMNSATEWDIKKVIALSTLSQMSIMFITISMNLFELAMFHLLVHATFKALIFLCSSTLISLSNTQDIRKMNKLTKNMFTTKLSMNTATLSLMGFPFMSSFYSKEMIMEMNTIKKMNTVFIWTFYICMMMTLFYSMKIMLFINNTNFKQPMIPMKETQLQKKSKLMMLIPAITYGNKMNWLMNLNFKIPHLTKSTKMIPIIMMISTAILIKELYKSNEASKMMNNTQKNMITYMWFMKNLSIQTKKITLTLFFSSFKNSEKLMFTKMIKTLKVSLMKASSTNFKLIHKTQQKMNLLILMLILITV